MKQIKENAKTKMEKSINVMLSDFAGIRAGRANPSVLNSHGISQLSSLSKRLSRLLISASIHRMTALLSDLLSHSSLRTDVRNLLRTSRKWAKSAR